MSDSRSVTRLRLRRYKSIELCEIELAPITLLVGRNGAGKSNLLDALRFVLDALQNTLDYAFRQRGGVDGVRRKSLSGRNPDFEIELELNLPSGSTASYGFTVRSVAGGFTVRREHCIVRDAGGGRSKTFKLDDGNLEWSLDSARPAVTSDRLLLVAASGTPPFREVFDVLTRMTFHNLNPEVMRYPQRPEPGMLLTHDGRNLPSVVKQLPPAALLRVQEYLQAVGSPVNHIRHKQEGALETIEVAQQTRSVNGLLKNLSFDAISLSDGTIRAMGILVSLFSARGRREGGPTLIGIEEPETALHPAAAGALMDALTEASEKTQLVLTCHSPDLLDHPAVEPQMIRPVLLENGRTLVGQLRANKQALLQNHLSTAGELLRLDQLEPDPEDLRRQSESHGTLWEQA